MHILLAVPSPDNVNPDFALGNFQDIISYTHKKFPDWKISTAYKTGVRTDANRNHILYEALWDGTIDYILWLDADMLYPASILEAYFEASESLHFQIDIMGCMYFKRPYPHDPVAYELNDGWDKDVKPFRSVLPSVVQGNTIWEVAGLGYGGMLVNMNVYKKLGMKRWTHYAQNFHLPFPSPEHITHDLQFCLDAKEAGCTVLLHGGVKPGHFNLHPVTYDDWQKAQEETFTFFKKPPKVLVIMPATNKELAEKSSAVMRERAGADCDIVMVLDENSQGFNSIINTVATSTSYEAIVYTAQDAFVGQNWLKHALVTMVSTNAGLVAFNDGKWNGQLASFGLVRMDWVKHVYGGAVFFPGYYSHYGDTELTQIAKQQEKFAYSEKAIMLEIDHDKAVGKGRGVVKADKKLFKKRKESGFDGLVTDQNILEEFS